MNTFLRLVIIVLMRIKEFRLLRKFKQNEFAKMIGVSPTTLFRYEKGILEPDIQTLKKIATALSTNVDTIIGFDSPMLDLRKLTDTQQMLVEYVTNLTPDNEKQVLGYIERIKDK